jgi:RNA polymerase sigma factor (sigma-70 family)
VARHDDEKLRRFLAARRAGDAAGARRYWEELLTDNFDRIHGMVVLESRNHLSYDEQQDALQRALIKLANNMIETFQGSSMGEWVNATRTLVKYACIDTQRREQTISRHERSLDAPGRGDDDAGRWDADVYAAIEKERRERESDEQAADALGDYQAFLDWAVPQLSPKLRAIIELDRAGVPVNEIQKRLGVSRDVVYQSRSRAVKQLAKLREEYGS